MVPTIKSQMQMKSMRLLLHMLIDLDCLEAGQMQVVGSDSQSVTATKLFVNGISIMTFCLNSGIYLFYSNILSHSHYYV